jgi:hypothetical protein
LGNRADRFEIYTLMKQKPCRDSCKERRPILSSSIEMDPSQVFATWGLYQAIPIVTDCQ